MRRRFGFPSRRGHCQPESDRARRNLCASEAQIDRFLMKVMVEYPTVEEETRLLALYLDPIAAPVSIEPVISLATARSSARGCGGSSRRADLPLHRRDRGRSRRPGESKGPDGGGLGPTQSSLCRSLSAATLAMAHVAKAEEFLQGRNYVIPEDVKEVAHDVCGNADPAYEARPTR